MYMILRTCVWIHGTVELQNCEILSYHGSMNMLLGPSRYSMISQTGSTTALPDSLNASDQLKPLFVLPGVKSSSLMNVHKDSSINGIIKIEPSMMEVTEPPQKEDMRLNGVMSCEDNYKDVDNHVLTLVQAESLPMQSAGQGIKPFPLDVKLSNHDHTLNINEYVGKKSNVIDITPQSDYQSVSQQIGSEYGFLFFKKW